MAIEFDVGALTQRAGRGQRRAAAVGVHAADDGDGAAEAVVVDDVGGAVGCDRHAGGHATEEAEGGGHGLGDVRGSSGGGR
ncbi:MAG TPA: hypothetical protein VGF99_00695 [Myxococcota bacterium]